jgi:hypothetical protein
MVARCNMTTKRPDDLVQFNRKVHCCASSSWGSMQRRWQSISAKSQGEGGKVVTANLNKSNAGACSAALTKLCVNVGYL